MSTHMHSTATNLQVLYEDNHLVVVNKRPGDIVQGDITGDTPLSEIVKEYIKIKYNKPGAVYLGVVHRLDRPTSGVVVFARTSKALARLNRMFAGKEVRKIYWAIVKRKPPKDRDTLVHWLKKNPKQNKSYAYPENVPESKRAELDYKLVRSLDHYHHLEIELKSGRHHQIRVQLAAIGSIIKGDLKYGSDRSNKDGSIHLHAYNIRFKHPVKADIINISAPVPDDRLWQECL